MTHHRQEAHKDFIDDARERQNNIVFPDTVRNARGVDFFLWNGNPNPSLVQRIAAWLFGLTLIGFGVLALVIARDAGSFFARMLAASGFLIVAKIFRNGFPRNRR